MRGDFKLYAGNMFANKTSQGMVDVERLREFGKKRVLVLKPTTDTRSGTGHIMDHHNNAMEAIEVPATNPHSVFNIIKEQERTLGRRFDVLVFDEIQFFSITSSFFQVIDALLERGYDIIAAGLVLDFKREPFGVTLLLVGLCKRSQDIILLTSYCSKCGKEALLPQRIINGRPAPYDSPQILVGGSETYEARCYECHELPGRPMLFF